MLYKTITLRLLEMRPRMYHQLRKQRLLLSMMEHYALQLKDRHEAWKDRLSQTRPDSDDRQIASEALEMALKELEEALPNESPPNEDD